MKVKVDVVEGETILFEDKRAVPSLIQKRVTRVYVGSGGGIHIWYVVVGRNQIRYASQKLWLKWRKAGDIIWRKRMAADVSNSCAAYQARFGKLQA